MRMGGGRRSLALLLFAIVAFATIGCSRTPASVQDTAAYSVRLLDLDGDAKHAPALDSLGREHPLKPMPRSLPYTREGSWVVVQVHRLPPQPRLVVEGQVADDVTLVLPDGRRMVRAKLRPDDDDAASSVALVYPLPPGLKTAATLRLPYR